MQHVRSSTCLGNITGKCIYDDENSEPICKTHKASECYPPVCSSMAPSCNESSNDVYCGIRKEDVNPWEICLKCNPKDNL